MADKPVCKVDGCNKPGRARGWCCAHYWRWRKHGDPLGGRPAYGKAADFIYNTAISWVKDECLHWPFADLGNGYGQITHKGRHLLAHRLVCELVHGEPPTPQHHAAHSCGNGHLGCVNPRHLSWKTASENEADKWLHGTAQIRGRQASRYRNVANPSASSP